MVEKKKIKFWLTKEWFQVPFLQNGEESKFYFEVIFDSFSIPIFETEYWKPDISFFSLAKKRPKVETIYQYLLK